jgi:hypothetical protein
VSYLLLALNTSKDEKPNPQEDVLGLENNLQLLNTQFIIPNSFANNTKINQILQELIGQNLCNIDVLALSICATLINKAAKTQRIFAIAFPTLYLLS